MDLEIYKSSAGTIATISIQKHLDIIPYIGMTLSCIATGACLLILTTICCIPGKFRPRLLFATNLILSELIASTWVFVEHALLYFGRHLELMCYTKALFGHQEFLSTIIFLSLICIDHYFAIMRPLRYRSTVTRERSFFAIAVTWMLVCLVFFWDPFMYGISVAKQNSTSGNECRELWFAEYDLSWMSFVSLTITFIGLVMIIILSVKIHQRTKRGLLLPDTPFSAGSKREQGKSSTTWVRYSTLTILLTITFVIFFIPALIMNATYAGLYYADLDYLHYRLHIGRDYGKVLRILKSVADPIIYVLLLGKIRQQFLWFYCNKGGVTYMGSMDMDMVTSNVSVPLTMASDQNQRNEPVLKDNPVNPERNNEPVVKDNPGNPGRETKATQVSSNVIETIL